MKNTHNINQLLIKLWSNINTRRKFQIGFLVILMFFASIAEIISIGMVLPFLTVLTEPSRLFNNQYINHVLNIYGIVNADELLFFVTFLFIVVVIFSVSIRILLMWIQNRLGYAIGSDFSMDIYRKTLYQPYIVHVSRNSSEVITGITSKSASMINHVIIPILTIINSFFVLIMVLGTLIILSPYFVPFSFLGFGFIYYLIMLFSKKKLLSNSKTVSRESSNLIKALQEGLGGIRDVLIDGSQETYLDIYKNADQPLRRANASITIIGSTPRYAVEALGMILIALVAFFISNQNEGLSKAIPILGALALGSQRILPVLQQVYLNWTYLMGSRESLSDILQFLEQPLPKSTNPENSALMSFQNKIEIKDLSFKYTNESPFVLYNLNFEIPKGSKVGFIGVTGSGKSTLIDIIMGLLTPNSGSVLIDNVKLNSKNISSWQKLISHVPQSIFLADSTISENIAFGVDRKKIDFDKIKLAAVKAQISNTIENWEDSYNTFVGERGIKLSGGQRQRIGIARAFYKKSSVIIFDEATSALDNNTEHEVMDAIDSLGNELTIIIIAHRLTTLKNCNIIFELNSNGIIKYDSYNEILLKK